MLIAFENNIRLDMLVCLRSSYRSPFPPVPCWGMRCFWLLAAVTARLVDCSTARPLQNGVYLMDCIDKRDNFIEYRDTKRARQLPLICDPSNCSSILSNCLAQLCWFIVSIRVRDRLLDLDLDLSSERSISPPPLTHSALLLLRPSLWYCYWHCKRCANLCETCGNFS